MNEEHAKLCSSPEWAASIQDEVLPALLLHADLGADMLEIGPGPGAATDWLRHRVKRLTAVEADDAAAAALAARYRDDNVEVTAGSGTELAYPDGSFDSVGTFTMLHHVPTQALQLRLLAEAFRVLRPGGALIGSDSLGRNDLHHFHADDTYNPVDPAVLLVWLRALGFGKVTIMVDWDLRVVAHKPGPEDTCADEPGPEEAPA
jgi:SAM-dependent methyltransferase